ncbi:hypothetical protein AB1Y20_010007 [Prymnesium parvum]|uniref:Nudix hydrolase domain-containing protein n=1 Tax=Prymnesium parvum TaxID=97485 RepID=A0AB34K6P8_PRYPA
MATQPRQYVVLLASPKATASLHTAATHVGLLPVVADSADTALALLRSLGEPSLAAVVCSPSAAAASAFWPLLRACQRELPRTFVMVRSATAASDLRLRLELFAAGAMMITPSDAAAAAALTTVARAVRGGGEHACPHCGMGGLTADTLREHMPFHHATHPNCEAADCPLCLAPLRDLPLVVHLQRAHGPPEAREPPPPPYAAFALVVVRRPSDGRFLLVHEVAELSGGRPGYWLPAGRVDAGESLVAAARRECVEEAGVAVEPCGVLRLMAEGKGASRVLRVVLLAVPVESDATPKSIPDFESCGALWCRHEELDQLRPDDFRHLDPVKLFPRVASGELQASSIDTPAWHALEAIVRRLTMDDRSARKELPAVWEDVVATYAKHVW